MTVDNIPTTAIIVQTLESSWLVELEIIAAAEPVRWASRRTYG
jgi:hypothetical protein